ncbi:hypothetical protein JXM83_04195 [Candidatus Woesearchaeota archaeon]|nr:hypothetical protein [Candidatus Woesearchaeota archaeon]
MIILPDYKREDLEQILEEHSNKIYSLATGDLYYYGTCCIDNGYLDLAKKYFARHELKEPSELDVTNFGRLCTSIKKDYLHRIKQVEQNSSFYSVVDGLNIAIVCQSNGWDVLKDYAVKTYNLKPFESEISRQVEIRKSKNI